MSNRRELEGLVLRGIQELKSLESSLDRRIAQLGRAPKQARTSFFLDLIHLEKRAQQLERIIDALDTSHRTSRLAA
jgi:hypothetical protein